MQEQRATVLPDADPVNTGAVVPQPKSGQLQFANDLGPKQAEHDRSGRETESRYELLGDTCSADQVASLNDRHRDSCSGQVASCDEAVVTGPDDHNSWLLTLHLGP